MMSHSHPSQSSSKTHLESHLTDVPDGFFEDEKARLKLLVGIQVARQRRHTLSRRLVLTCGSAAACAALFFAGRSVLNLTPDQDLINNTATEPTLRAQVTPSATAGDQSDYDQSYETYISDDSDYSSSDMLMWLY